MPLAITFAPLSMRKVASAASPLRQGGTVIRECWFHVWSLPVAVGGCWSCSRLHAELRIGVKPP